MSQKILGRLESKLEKETAWFHLNKDRWSY